MNVDNRSMAEALPSLIAATDDKCDAPSDDNDDSVEDGINSSIEGPISKTTAVTGGGGGRIAELKASLRRESILKQQSVRTSIADLDASANSHSGIADLKARLRTSIVLDAAKLDDSRKSWKGKDWFGDDNDEEDDDDGENEEKKSTPRRKFNDETFQATFGAAFTKRKSVVVPKELEAKAESIGTTKHGVSKRRLGNLKNLLQAGILDTVDENKRKKNQQSQQADDKPKGGSLLLNLMVKASTNVVELRTAKGVARERLDKAATKIQHFFRKAVFQLRLYKEKRRYLKQELKHRTSKKKKMVQLNAIQQWVQESKEHAELEIRLEMMESSKEEAKEFRKTAQKLQKSIQGLQKEGVSLKQQGRGLNHQNALLELNHIQNNPFLQSETSRLENRIQQSKNDAEEWKKLKQLYHKEIDDIHVEIDHVTADFKREQKVRKRVAKTVQKIVKRADTAGEEDEKWIKKINKLQTKRENQYQRLKQARKDGSIPMLDAADIKSIKERVQQASCSDTGQVLDQSNSNKPSNKEEKKNKKNSEQDLNADQSLLSQSHNTNMVEEATSTEERKEGLKLSKGALESAKKSLEDAKVVQAEAKEQASQEVETTAAAAATETKTSSVKAMQEKLWGAKASPRPEQRQQQPAKSMQEDSSALPESTSPEGSCTKQTKSASSTGDLSSSSLSSREGPASRSSSSSTEGKGKQLEDASEKTYHLGGNEDSDDDGMLEDIEIKKLDLSDISQALEFSASQENPVDRDRDLGTKRKKQKRKEQDKKDKKVIEALLQRRTSKVEGDGDSLFSEMLFSDVVSQGGRGRRASSAGEKKLKGAALLKGAVKDVIGRQRRASAFMTLMTAPEVAGIYETDSD